MRNMYKLILTLTEASVDFYKITTNMLFPAQEIREDTKVTEITTVIIPIRKIKCLPNQLFPFFRYFLNLIDNKSKYFAGCFCVERSMCTEKVKCSMYLRVYCITNAETTTRKKSLPPQLFLWRQKWFTLNYCLFLQFILFSILSGWTALSTTKRKIFSRKSIYNRSEHYFFYSSAKVASELGEKFRQVTSYIHRKLVFPSSS